MIGSTEDHHGGDRLKAMAEDGTLRVPVVAVNESATKHLFDNRYGTGQSALDGIIRATNILMAGSTMVVVGYGDCGRGVAERADRLGARVIVVEVDPVRALDAAVNGAPGHDDIGRRRRRGRVHHRHRRHVLRQEHFDRMKDGAVLANAGHFDAELELTSLRSTAVERRVARTNLEEFVMPDRPTSSSPPRAGWSISAPPKGTPPT